MNVREQQDAFDFFCNLTDQVDEQLKVRGEGGRGGREGEEGGRERREGGREGGRERVIKP